MANFSDTLDLIEDQVRATFCDDAKYRALAGGGDLDVRIKFRNSSEDERLAGVAIVAPRPTIKVAVSQVARVVKGDIFVYDGWLYRVAEAPTRPGRGRWWFCNVEKTVAA